MPSRQRPNLFLFVVNTSFVWLLKEGLSIEFDVDEKLQRGDIVIKSGDITLEEINSKKIKLSNDSKIDLSVISEDG